MQLPFSERWRMLEDEIIRPRYHEKTQFESGVKSNPLYKYDMELFSVSDSILYVHESFFLRPYVHESYEAKFDSLLLFDI
jgi:hypothetical protein